MADYATQWGLSQAPTFNMSGPWSQSQASATPGPITPGGQPGNSEQEEAQRKIVKQYLDAMHKLEQAKFNLQFPEPVKPKSPGKQEGGTAIIGSIIEML